MVRFAKYTSLFNTITLTLASTNPNDTADWRTVDQYSLFQDLSECAKPCVRDVNLKIWDVEQQKFCESQGCVCSDSTRGPNYLYGMGNITSCVQSSCQNSSDIAVVMNKTLTVFDKLCYVQQFAQNDSSTGRITTGVYPLLLPCPKFEINGCFSKNGTMTEPNCGPEDTSRNQTEWKGIWNAMNCTPDDKRGACICDGANFQKSCGLLYENALLFCPSSMKQSTNSSRNRDQENMLQVLSTYCIGGGFNITNCTHIQTGVAPGSFPLPKEWGPSAIIQATFTILAALIAIVALVYTGLTYKYMRGQARQAGRP